MRGRCDTGRVDRAEFDLDPTDVHLNHGSFGAVPRTVRAEQEALRARMDRGFDRFYADELRELLERSRRAVAGWLDADPDGLVQVPNATTAVWTALQALRLAPGDRVVTTTHEYAATDAMLDHLAARGVEVVRVPAERVLEAVDAATRCVLVSHVTSPWGEVRPVAALHDALAGSGVELVVDGAHGPGLSPVALRRLPSAWYAATLAKWSCFPRGAGALAVPGAHRDSVQPTPISLGGHDPGLAERFAWTGTRDLTPQLVGDAVVAFHARAAAAGWVERAEALAAWSREQVLAAVPTALVLSDPALTRMTTYSLEGADGLAAALRSAGVWTWTRADGERPGRTLLRVSIALYSDAADVEALLAVLARPDA